MPGGHTAATSHLPSFSTVPGGHDGSGGAVVDGCGVGGAVVDGCGGDKSEEEVETSKSMI